MGVRIFRNLLKSFQLKVKNCKLSYPPHKEVEISENPNEQKTITGVIMHHPREVKILIADPAATKELIIYLKRDMLRKKPEKDFMYALTFNDKTLAKNPTFKNPKRGTINILGNKYIDLEKAHFPNSEVSISTDLKRLNQFSIGTEGIFVAIISKSDQIKVNGKNQARSYLDIFLDNKALALIIGFLIIVADKWILILFQKN